MAKSDKTKKSKTNVKKTDVLDNSNNKINKKIYFSYNARVLFTTIFTILFLFSSLFLILTSFSISKLESINYREISKMDYKVYLKENEFFNENYLPKDMTYVANLIKNITVNFNYQFDIDKPSNLNFNYKIIGKLLITNQKDGKVFLEKDYVLLNDIKEMIKNGNTFMINKEIVIDYGYYNNLANNFKYNYGVDAESKLTVDLVVDEKNSEDNSFEFENNTVMSLNVPLSEKAIDIKLDYKDISENRKIFASRKTIIDNKIKFVLGIICLFISLLCLTELLKLLLILLNIMLLKLKVFKSYWMQGIMSKGQLSIILLLNIKNVISILLMVWIYIYL